MIKKITILLPVCLMTLTGCSSKLFNPNTPDPAMVRISQVAETIQKHDNDLAAIETARYLEKNKTPIQEINVSDIPSLERVVSLGGAWHGPIGPLVTKLSSLGGLNAPRFIGVKPSSDVVVNVNTDYRRIVDMLHDAGTQAGSRAKVVLKMKERLVEVEYHPY